MDNKPQVNQTKPSEIICVISLIVMLISYLMVWGEVLAISSILFVLSLSRILIRLFYPDGDVLDDSYIDGGDGTGLL